MINPRPELIPIASGVYHIKNRVNGYSYIGSATKLNKRRSAHICTLNKGNHHSSYLQRSWRKYGAENFEFIVLELAEKAILIKREQFFIDALLPEYNDCPIAGTNEGRKLSPEHKAKLIAASKGRVVSLETREKIRQALLGRPSPKPADFGEKSRLKRLGKRHTEETKELIRQTKLKRYEEDPDLLERLRVAHLGKKQSPEVVRKRVESTNKTKRLKKESECRQSPLFV